MSSGMSKLAGYRDKSRVELARINEKLRARAKESAKLGGLGNEMASAGTNMVVRHLMTGLFGEAAKSTTTQRIMLALLSVGSLGLRVGLARGKSSEGVALLAAAASGVFSATAERLIQAMAGIGEAG